MPSAMAGIEPSAMAGIEAYTDSRSAMVAKLRMVVEKAAYFANFDYDRWPSVPRAHIVMA